MSLATRCPSCGTVFRVVPDQLRISEGWVRCGRCSGVFEATEALFDIDTGAPMRLAPATPPPPPPARAQDDEDDGLPTPKDWAARSAALPPRPPPPAPPPPAPGERVEPRLDGPAAWPAPAAADQREEPLLRAPSADADDDIVITDHAPPPADAAAALAASVAAARHPVPAAPPPAAAEPAVAEPAAAAPVAPSFVRAAERAQRWRSPAARGLLAGAVAVLAVLLALQAARIWRDPLAAQLPAMLPALQALCRATGCTVQPLRRLDALGVDSSALNRVEGSSLYRLQVVLRNRADTAVMVPALELTLNDGQGQVVARRVLPLAELGAPQAVLQAGQELPLQALLSTGERRVDGYTVDLFYP